MVLSVIIIAHLVMLCWLVLQVEGRLEEILSTLLDAQRNTIVNSTPGEPVGNLGGKTDPPRAP